MSHIPCPHCEDGWTSRPAEPCRMCDGTGHALCLECDTPAATTFRYRGEDYPVCATHYRAMRANEDTSDEAGEP